MSMNARNADARYLRAREHARRRRTQHGPVGPQPRRGAQ